MLLFLVLALFEDVVRMLLVYRFLQSDADQLIDTPETEAFGGTDSWNGWQSAFALASKRVEEKLVWNCGVCGQAFSRIYASRIGEMACWGLLLVGLWGSGRSALIAPEKETEPPEHVKQRIAEQLGKGVPVPEEQDYETQAENLADEARQAVRRNDFRAAGKILDELFSRYWDTHEAIKALQLIALMDEGMTRKAGLALQMGLSYSSWGGMNSSSRGGGDRTITFVNVEACKLLLRAIERGDSGDSSGAYSIIKTDAHQVRTTPFAAMAGNLGAAWAGRLRGAAFKREETASSLVVKGTNLAREGKHREAAKTWGELKRRHSDTLIALTLSALKERIADELIAESERRAESGDLENAICGIRQVIHFYPRTQTSQTALGRMIACFKKNPTYGTKKEIAAYDGYTDALQVAKSGDYPEAARQMQKTTATYGVTIASVFAREWLMDQKEFAFSLAKARILAGDSKGIDGVVAMLRDVFGNAHAAQEIEDLLKDRGAQAEELLQLSRTRAAEREFSKMGRYLDRLFEEYGETPAAFRALHFVHTIRDTMASEALAILRKGGHPKSWGGIGWSSGSGRIEDVSFSNIKAARLLEEGHDLADQGSYEEAHGVMMQLLKRYSHTSLAGMACARGSAWAENAGGEIARRERSAMSLSNRANSSIAKGDHAKASEHWEQLQLHHVDTIVCNAHKLWRRENAETVLEDAVEKASGGDYARASEMALHVVKLYPEAASARTAMTYGIKWRLAQNDRLAKLEEKAQDLYVEVVASADANHTATMTSMGKLFADYPATFTAHIGRHWMENEWKNRVYRDAVSLVHRSEFDKAEELARNLRQVCNDINLATKIEILLSERRNQAETINRQKAKATAANELLLRARARAEEGKYDEALAITGKITSDFGDTLYGRLAKNEAIRWRNKQDLERNKAKAYIFYMIHVRDNIKRRSYSKATATLRGKQRDLPYETRQAMDEALSDIQRMSEFWTSDISRIGAAFVGKRITLAGRTFTINAVSRKELYLSGGSSIRMESRLISDIPVSVIVQLRSGIADPEPDRLAMGLLLWAEGLTEQARSQFGKVGEGCTNLAWRKSLCGY